MDPAFRRTLVSLSVSFALMWAAVSMVAGPGSAALVALTGNLSHAGLFIALFYVAAAIGAAIGGRLMDRHGRRPVLVAGQLIAAVGYGAAGYAVRALDLPIFVVGGFLLAAGFGVVNLTRVAAAELFPPQERGRAVAWVQVSATVGAVVGPLLLIGSDPLGALLGRPPLTLVWWLAPPLLVVAALFVLRAEEPLALAKAVASPDAAGSAAAPASVPSNGLLLMVGLVALAASQASMAAVMGVAGAAVAHTGHGVRTLGLLMLVHFVGMFGLSRLVGRVADRVGRRTTILSGLVLLAVGGAVIALVGNVWGFAVGLLLSGLGWSFGFIGATVLLTDITVPSRRARIMGRADLLAQLSAAVVALGGGVWYAVNGMTGLGVLAILVVTLPALFLFLVIEGTPGAYGRQRS
ncbi:MAG: MFS transporter [Euryarchaeota archaeon]|nr:MFS transporter [Euryarchaeota archaeon]